MNKKYYVGNNGYIFNYYQRDFREISYVYQELTGVYISLYSNNHLEINKMKSQNLSDILLDFSTFFDKLLLVQNKAITITSNNEQYIQLNAEALEGTEIITEIVGELAKIRNEVYDNKQIKDKDKWNRLLEANAEYINTSNIKLQENLKKIENIIKLWT